MVCAYCGKARAVNKDHVIPKSLRKRRESESKWMRRVRIPTTSYYPDHIPPELLVTVASCFPCNMRKGTRRLVPPSWANRVELLNELFPGTPWHVWNGDPKHPSFTAVHV